MAFGVWLTRYDLLLKNNSDAATIKRGAQYLDVTGFFSSLNYIWLTSFVVLGVTGAVFVLLRRCTIPPRPAAASRLRRRRPDRDRARRRSTSASSPPSSSATGSS